MMEIKMIEIKIKCLNPGCDIHYIIDEPPEATEDLAGILDAITQNIIQVMNARELFYKQIQNSNEDEKPTIIQQKMSDASSKLEFGNE